MAVDDQRLTLVLEARVTEFERRMANAEKRAAANFRKMQVDSAAAAKSLEGNMTRAGAKIDTALASVNTRVAGFGKTFAASLAGGAVAGAFAGFSANIGGMIRDIATVGDEARRAGISAQSFQEWKFVAEQNRIGMDAFIDGFKELNLRADEFIVTGAGPAAEAFRRLGFTASDLEERLKDPSDLMLEMIGRLQGLDRAAQIRIADEVFGGTGGERFVEIIGQGEAKLRQTIARAHELGAVLTDEAIASAAALDQKFGELQTRVASFLKGEIVQFGEDLGKLREEIEAILTLPSRAAAGLQSSPAEKLAAGYNELATAGQSAANALGNLVTPLEQSAGLDVAGPIAELSDALQIAINDYRDGTIEAAEFAEKVGALKVEAEGAVQEIGAIDGISFQTTIDNLGAIGQVLENITALANKARAAMPAGPGQDTGTGLTIADIELPGSGVAPTSSIRPQSPGVNSYGDWSAAAAGTGGGASGGGKTQQEKDIEAAKELFEETRTQAEQYGAALAELNRLYAEGDINSDLYQRGLEGLEAQFGGLQGTAAETAGMIANAFVGLFDDPKQALMDLAEQFLQMIIYAQVMRVMTMSMGGGMGGAGGGLGGIIGALFGIIPNAKGGVYSGAGISAHSGSVVSSPTMFAFASGAGLMGEAGPEAILPLARGGDGKLGVVSQGGAGGAGTDVQIHNYSGQEAQAKRSRGPDGREVIRVIVGEEIGRGSFSKQLSGRYGVKDTTVRR